MSPIELTSRIMDIGHSLGQQARRDEADLKRVFNEAFEQQDRRGLDRLMRAIQNYPATEDEALALPDSPPEDERDDVDRFDGRDHNDQTNWR